MQREKEAETETETEIQRERQKERQEERQKERQRESDKCWMLQAAPSRAAPAPDYEDPLEGQNDPEEIKSYANRLQQVIKT